VEATLRAVTAPPNNAIDSRETRALVHAEPLAVEARKRMIGAVAG
jgi:hypothetical protein